MSTLYVVEDDARLEKEYGRILVTRNDEVLLRVPLGRVSRVVIVGRGGVTTPALHSLLHAAVPLLFISRSGRLLGQLTPPTPANLPLRRAQLRRDADEGFCLELARSITAGKLRNQRTLMRRMARRDGGQEEVMGTAAVGISAVDDALGRLAGATDLDTVRGIEGGAARAFFRVYRAAIGPDWKFVRRNRRPPRDPVNGLLSLGYSLLTQNMISALEIVGLDPHLGYYHAETYGRPALALDLVEEFRTPIVDSLVLTMLRRRMLSESDFETDPESGGVQLKVPALRVFLRQFSGRLESQIMVRELGRRLSYRKLFEVQARRLARTIADEADEYRPFRAR